LASLLNESSSDENAEGSEGSDDEEATSGNDNFDASDLVIDFESEISTGKKLMMMEEEEKCSSEM
jgi:thioredoxin-related protein